MMPHPTLTDLLHKLKVEDIIRADLCTADLTTQLQATIHHHLVSQCQDEAMRLAFKRTCIEQTRKEPIKQGDPVDAWFDAIVRDEIATTIDLAKMLRAELAKKSMPAVSLDELRRHYALFSDAEWQFDVRGTLAGEIISTQNRATFNKMGQFFQYVSVNRDNCDVIFKHIHYQIDPDSKDPLHQELNAIRLQLPMMQHFELFGCIPSVDGPFNLPPEKVQAFIAS
ncbi:MAG: hypothetical protein KDH94_04035, partial [Coxiellaceae bacterium]|nr:hypothetical protein [Coxiellaceae bacterium]